MHPMHSGSLLPGVEHADLSPDRVVQGCTHVRSYRQLILDLYVVVGGDDLRPYASGTGVSGL